MTCNGHHHDSSYLMPDFQICIVGDTLKENEDFLRSVEHFNLPIVYSSTGVEFINQGAEYTTIFVLDEFDGEIYTALHKAGQRILGPTAIMQCAAKNEHLPNNIRPLYTSSMKKLVVTYTGFRNKDELTTMVALVHHMGGSIRKDFNVTKTTHLVASLTIGDKYRYAASFGIPIMTSDWIYQTWARRHDIECQATNEDMMQFKLLPFVGCKIAFVGYQEKEHDHMVEILTQNGGEVVALQDATHIVVEDGSSLDPCEYNVHLVKSEWFWACIQMEAKAEERLYPFEKCGVLEMTSSSLILPSRGSKRKRYESVAHQLAMESLQDSDFFSRKGEVAKLSISGSFLDATMSPDRSIDLAETAVVDLKSLSPRHQVCLELHQTETNYVSILHTIVTVFKEPLELQDQVGGPLLAPAEIKIIFGNLPPIYEVHQKLRAQLTEIIHNWDEDNSIGSLILTHANEFMKAYPPFVNFFEKTKLVLNNCDTTKPRFHAFLKRCQSKPECGRQTLQELLIRPVQRLPSVILLLNDILKHTQKNNDDFQALEKAIQALKDVMMHINEDKRKTEGQVAMFDIVNDIENCPANLLSSHRQFVAKADTQEVTDLLSKKNDIVTMFLFSDVLEICKKRSKYASTMKSPGVVSLASAKPLPKCFKHLELMPLSNIKRVVDILETEECKNVFAIVVRSNKELKELLYVFVLVEEVCKSAFLRTLCRQVANSVCKADAENLLTCLEPQQLALPDSAGNVLTKALLRTRDKLGRALSMRRTPTKRGLSRAVSTIISPLRSLSTPSNTMSTLRLSSVSNLTELDPSSSRSSLTSSPVSGKKMKSSSLGISISKYL